MRKLFLALAVAAATLPTGQPSAVNARLTDRRYWAIGKEPWQGQGKRKMPKLI